MQISAGIAGQFQASRFKHFNRLQIIRARLA
jgi:hypothetical protein